MPESRFSHVVRMVVGVSLLLESAVILLLALFAAIVGSFVGLLAFGAGAGGATDKQLAQTGALLVLTLASPFVMGGVLGTGGVLVLLRRQRGGIIAAGVLAIAAQGAYHWLGGEGFHAAESVPTLIHALTIAIGLSLVPAAPAANTAPT